MTSEASPWYFLHIPKTAGTTFRVMLENTFPIDAICPAYEFFDLKKYTPRQLGRFQLFRGHMGYNLVNFLDSKPKTMVMLRDPAERALSHFEYLSRDPSHPKHAIINSRGIGIDEYLKDPRLRADLINAQVLPLAHQTDRDSLRDLLQRTSSQQEFSKAWHQVKGVLPPKEALLDVALERLEKMAFVGIAEELEQGMELASWLLGNPPARGWQSLNVNPHRTRLEDLSDETLDLLHEITALDRKLYDHGKKLFHVQYQVMRTRRSAGKRPPCMEVRRSGKSLVLGFEQPLSGAGWHQRELVPGLGFVRWTGPGDMACVEVKLPERKKYFMKIYLAGWVNEEVLRNLQVEVDGKPIRSAVEAVSVAGSSMYAISSRGRITATGKSCLRICLVAPPAVPGQEDSKGLDHNYGRPVGVAVHKFEFVS